MSNLSITNLLALLQNPAQAQQQVADATNNGEPASATSASAATGQNLPTNPAATSANALANGASTPVMSSDMTAVLLQMQQSQEMSDAQALLYGDSSSNGSSLLDYLDGGSNSSSTSDPMQALLDQLTGTSNPQSGSASLMSSNQSLLDYLNAIDTSGVSTTSTGTNANGSTSNTTGNQTTATDTAMLEAIFNALDQTPATTGTPASSGTPQNPPVTAATTAG